MAAVPPTSPPLNEMHNFIIALRNGVDRAVADAVIGQGLVVLADLTRILDTVVNDICRSCWRPGGLIQPVPGLPPINNPGIAIPTVLQHRLKIAVFATKYYTMVGRPLDLDALHQDRIENFQQYKEDLESWQQSQTLAEFDASKQTIMQWIKLALEYFLNKLGASNVPLVYVIQDNTVPTPIANNPLLNIGVNTNAFGKMHTSFNNKAILRTSHTRRAFSKDNASVLNTLFSCLAKTSYMNSLKPCQQTRDGRAAFKALELHNMGLSKWDKLTQKAEEIVMKHEWNGTNKRYKLAYHIRKHRAAHIDMERASRADNYTYQVPQEHTRVNCLLISLVCKDPRIVLACTMVRSDPDLMLNFKRAANCIKTNALSEDEKESRYQTHRISAVKHGFQKVKKGKTGVEFRYYKKTNGTT